MTNIIPQYIQTPLLPITITVIGAGGTGNVMLTHLARIAYSYQELFNKKIVVTVIDGDDVSHSNIGRQLYAPSEVGFNKAVIAVNRINRFYGFDWIAVADYFNDETKDVAPSNFIISCVDNVECRFELHKTIKVWCKSYKNEPEYYPHFWIDIGNTKTTGNVVVGSINNDWPDVIDMYKNEFKKMKKDVDEPSCSLAMSLNKQDMFINSHCALIGSKWLWEALTMPEINWRGAFTNLNTFQTNKIKIDAIEKRN